MSERLERESSNESEKRLKVNRRFLCLLVLTHVLRAVATASRDAASSCCCPSDAPRRLLTAAAAVGESENSDKQWWVVSSGGISA